MSTLKYGALASLLLLAPLVAGCDSGAKSDAAQSASTTTTTSLTDDAAFRGLEQEHGARVGLFTIDTGTGKTLGYRQDERFAFDSTFKGLACGALLHAHPLATGFFGQVVHFTAADLVTYSPVTSTKVDTGMTVTELCEAAITRSDNTAGNQVLKLLGGPGAVTTFLRSIGDQVTRMDRWEPDLNTNIPGDDRDTTTPAALADDYRKLVVGDTLGEPERTQLTAWLLANTTGDARIRAGLPADWKTGDKTGAGDYGTANDVAVTWPAGGGAPLVIVVLTTKPDQAAAGDNPLVAAVAKEAVGKVR
ncbi:class A beta-lactamase [Nocardia sp. ET3-3]|uniref:Beta-lactamase n=1 Tax=Nocardia terrae TaxID=2675851 RepID=A0A7K1UNP2_9NOCA|nr:class A beta-lactamase [Nocardia terrae]MVU75962.1 class A beta-lactamase [Nocardia terrae]